MPVSFEHPPCKVIFERGIGIIDILKNAIAQFFVPCIQCGKTVSIIKVIEGEETGGDTVDKAMRIVDFKRGTEISL